MGFGKKDTKTIKLWQKKEEDFVVQKGQWLRNPAMVKDQLIKEPLLSPVDGDSKKQLLCNKGFMLAAAVVKESSLIKIDEHGLDLYYIMERTYEEDKQKNELAIECFDSVLQIDLNYKQAFYGKGLALMRLGKHKLAIDCFKHALTLDNQFKEALNNMAQALMRLERYEEAIESLDRALAIDPHCIDALKNKGLCLVRLKLIKEAIGCFNRALSINPYNEEIIKFVY